VCEHDGRAGRVTAAHAGSTLRFPRTAAERTATGDPWHAIVKEEHPLRRLERPRLVVDPTPYRPSPVLRGPEHLLLEVEEVQSSAKPLAKLAQH
jgi:hypothetical protein